MRAGSGQVNASRRLASRAERFCDRACGAVTRVRMRRSGAYSKVFDLSCLMTSFVKRSLWLYPRSWRRFLCRGMGTRSNVSPGEIYKLSPSSPMMSSCSFSANTLENPRAFLYLKCQIALLMEG